MPETTTIVKIEQDDVPGNPITEMVEWEDGYSVHTTFDDRPRPHRFQGRYYDHSDEAYFEALKDYTERVEKLHNKDHVRKGNQP